MHTQSLPQEPDQATEQLRWLPDSRVWRVVFGVLAAGVSGLVAGTMAMAAGEYVSVSSQADTEQADLRLERNGLETDDKFEHEELAAIYVERGLDVGLAKEVAKQLMDHDALGAHARDELGISETLKARPYSRACIGGKFHCWSRYAAADGCCGPDRQLIPTVIGMRPGADSD